MTDIDYGAEISLSYQEGDLAVVISLAGYVSQMWRQRYEALARAREV